MGQLTSTQHVPLQPFQQYQDWRLSDVQTVLHRFERDPSSFGFKLTQVRFETLVRDLPDRNGHGGGGGGGGGGGSSNSDRSTSPPERALSSMSPRGRGGERGWSPMVTPRGGGGAKGMGRGTTSHGRHFSIASVSSPFTTQPAIVPPLPIGGAAAAAAATAAMALPPIPAAVPSSLRSTALPTRSLHASSPSPTPSPPPQHLSASPIPPAGSSYITPRSARRLSHRLEPAPASHLRKLSLNEEKEPPPHRSSPSPPPPPASALSPPASASTSSPHSSIFAAWIGPERFVDEEHLDFLQLSAGLTLLCRARFHEKVRLLFTLFDWDEDGVLNRGELQALVRAVCIILHRMYGIGVSSNTPITSTYAAPRTSNAHPSSSSSSTREPTLKQCDRWNDQFVRRFESSLRMGSWTLDGLLEFSSSSPVVVHLLCGGCRTVAGNMVTLDGHKVQQKMNEAHGEVRRAPISFNGAIHVQQRNQQTIARGGMGMGSATARGGEQRRGGNARPQNGAQTARSHPAGRSSSSDLSSSPAPAPMHPSGSSSSVHNTNNSNNSNNNSGLSGLLPTSGSNRFKFQGKSTLREVKNLKRMFDDLDAASGSTGYVSLDTLRRPKKYTDPFLLRDVTVVFQEWRGFDKEKEKEGKGREEEEGSQNASHKGHTSPSSTSSTSSTAPRNEISFSELLDVLYPDLSPEDHALLHSWIPEPINRAQVVQIQRLFERLDTEYTGRVKFIKILEAFRTDVVFQSNPHWQKLIEPFSRLRPHRLEIGVSIRELLTALFNRSHPKQLKKILGWTKPTKALSPEQQAELQVLFNNFDQKNEGAFPVSMLRNHLINRGLPEKEVEEMIGEIQLVYPDAAKSSTHTSPSRAAPPRSLAAASPSSSSPSPSSEPLVTLQEFLLFYRNLWDSYVNFTLPTPRQPRSHHTFSNGIKKQEGAQATTANKKEQAEEEEEGEETHTEQVAS